MTTKTEWLGWLEGRAGRLQQRYRKVWGRRMRHRNRLPAPVDALPSAGRRWGAIVAHVEREAREVVVHLELPEPHTAEADVRVIDSTLAISVLRRGRGIEQAKLEDCYRRAIPLPPQVDPGSAVHKVHGDELVIRMQPKSARGRSTRAGAKRRKQPDGEHAGVEVPDEAREGAAPGTIAAPKKGGRKNGKAAQVSELPTGGARQHRSRSTRNET